MHVVETGNPRGRPIVFIHGLSQCWLQWSRQMNSSLVDDHRLVALDMRGHGLSDKPRHGYDDSKQWADDIDAVIQALSFGSGTEDCGLSLAISRGGALERASIRSSIF